MNGCLASDVVPRVRFLAGQVLPPERGTRLAPDRRAGFYHPHFALLRACRFPILFARRNRRSLQSLALDPFVSQHSSAFSPTAPLSRRLFLRPCHLENIN
jgi:hypothetical protein